MATTKRASKKVAAKKVASKRAAKTITAVVDSSRMSDLILKQSDSSLLDLKDDFSNGISEALEVIENRSKGALKFMSAAQLRRTIIPTPSLAFQYMIGARGIRRSTITEFIADEGLGKTTLLFHLAGWFCPQGCLGQYIDVESKTPDPNRMKQSLHRNRKMADAILKRNMLTFSDAPTVAEITTLMPAWARSMRLKADEQPFTSGKPIFSLVDLWSMALTASEAAGGWIPTGAKAKVAAPAKKGAKPKAGAKLKKIEEGSKPDHAKASQEYFRRIKPVMSKLNWSMFITTQRNDRLDMGGGGTYAKPAARTNDTARGGKALKQGSALRITMTRIGKWENKGDGPDHGHYLELHCLKNSYGWPGRSCIARVRTDQVGATEEKYAEAFSFAEADCNLLLERGIFGMKLDGGLYSSEELEWHNLRPEDFFDRLHADPALIEKAGIMLGIPGYGDIAAAVELDGVENAEEPEPEDDDESDDEAENE